MPVRGTDVRRQALQAAEARRDLLDRALRDQDWIERLTNNDDFKKYLARVQEAQAITIDQRDKIVARLSGVLETRDERAELNEKLMVVSATIEATHEVTNWPKMQEARLEDARKELPDLEAKIKELKGE